MRGGNHRQTLSAKAIVPRSFGKVEEYHGTKILQRIPVWWLKSSKGVTFLSGNSTDLMVLYFAVIGSCKKKSILSQNPS